MQQETQAAIPLPEMAAELQQMLGQFGEGLQKGFILSEDLTPLHNKLSAILGEGLPPQVDSLVDKAWDYCAQWGRQEELTSEQQQDFLQTLTALLEALDQLYPMTQYQE